MKQFFLVLTILLSTSFMFAEDFFDTSIKKYSKMIENFFNKGTYILILDYAELFNTETYSHDIIVQESEYINKQKINSITFQEDTAIYIDNINYHFEMYDVYSDENYNIIIKSKRKIKNN